MGVGIREEAMGPHMTKFYLEGLPGGTVLHRFTAADFGDFHDHPWDFWSYIAYGGYVEEVLHDDGSTTTVTHHENQSFFVPQSHRHRLIEIHASEVWTLITPRGIIQPIYFYRVGNEGLQRRLAGTDDWHSV